MFDRNLSNHIDRTLVKLEASHGIRRWWWRMVKRWLEQRIP